MNISKKPANFSRFTPWLKCSWQPRMLHFQPVFMNGMLTCATSTYAKFDSIIFPTRGASST